MFARYDEETPALQYVHRHENQYHHGERTCAIEQTDDGQFEVYCFECPFSVSEVAEMYDTNPRTVRYWCESGTLKAHKFAGVWAIDSEALETFERPRLGRPKENDVNENYILHQGNIPGQLRVTHQHRWYVSKETWEGAQLLDTRSVFSSMDEKEARAKLEELRGTR